MKRIERALTATLLLWLPTAVFSANSAYNHAVTAAQSFAANKQYKQAIASDLKAIAIDPHGEQAYDDCASYYQITNSLGDAYSIGMRGLACLPHSSTLLSRVAHILLVQQKYDDSLGFITSALDNHPNALTLFHAHVTRALVYLALNRPTDAINDAKIAIQTEPKKAKGYILMSSIYLRLKQSDKAIEWLHQAQEAAPANPHVPFKLGCLYVTLNRQEEALKQFTKAQSMCTSDKTLRSVILCDESSLLLDQHRLEEALRCAQDAHKYDPSNPAPIYKTALVYRAQNRIPETITQLSQAYKLGGDANLLVERAELYMRSGNYADALNDFEKCKKILPVSSNGYMLIGFCQSRLKQWAAAHESFRKL